MSGRDGQIALVPRHGDLEPLVAIAQVGQPQKTTVGRRHALARQPRVRFVLQLGVDRRHRRQIVAGRRLQARARVVVAHLAAEQAERGEHARVARHHDRAHAEQRGQRAAVQRAGAPEGHQRERARVVAALDRHQADGADHGVVDDVEDAAGRRLQAEPERPGHPLGDGLARPLDVEPDLPARQMWRKAAEDQVGVGHGRLLAARCRSRPGPAPRPRSPGPTVRVPSSATRAMEPPPAPMVWMSIMDTPSGHAPMVPSVVTCASPPADQAHVRAGPADVDGDDVGEARRRAHQPRADHARRRARSARCGSPVGAPPRRATTPPLDFMMRSGAPTPWARSRVSSVPT